MVSISVVLENPPPPEPEPWHEWDRLGFDALENEELLRTRPEWLRTQVDRLTQSAGPHRRAEAVALGLALNAAPEDAVFANAVTSVAMHGMTPEQMRDATLRLGEDPLSIRAFVISVYGHLRPGETKSGFRLGREGGDRFVDDVVARYPEWAAGQRRRLGLETDRISDVFEMLQERGRTFRDLDALTPEGAAREVEQSKLAREFGLRFAQVVEDAQNAPWLDYRKTRDALPRLGLAATNDNLHDALPVLRRVKTPVEGLARWADDRGLNRFNFYELFGKLAGADLKSLSAPLFGKLLDSVRVGNDWTDLQELRRVRDMISTISGRLGWGKREFHPISLTGNLPPRWWSARAPTPRPGSRGKAWPRTP